MSFHFTQICAFIAYSFRFYGLLFVFYRGKDTQFFKGARIWVFFFQMERKNICNSALIRHRNQRHIQHDRNPCKGGWREVVATYSLVVIYTIPFVALSRGEVPPRWASAACIWRQKDYRCRAESSNGQCPC